VLGTLLLLQSCHVQIENDRRIAVNGRVVNSEGNPIQNISVRCETNGEILGEGVSDENGNFKFVSLESENSSVLDILVNVKQNSYDYDEFYYDLNYAYGTGDPENEEYSGVRYSNTENNRDRSSYNLGQIQLNGFATLNLLLNNNPGDENFVSYLLEYTNDVCQIELNETNNEIDCRFSEDYFTVLEPESTNTEVTLKSQLGTIVLFNYQINNEPAQIISIPLTNPVNTYVFEY
jgi:hypothetical protein